MLCVVLPHPDTSLFYVSVPLYCTWMELPDTSVAEGPPTNTTFVLSQEECTEYCDSLPACVVAVFNAPECRVFDHVVTPVDDVGSVYLQKFCASTGNFLIAVCFLCL